MQSIADRLRRQHRRSQIMLYSLMVPAMLLTFSLSGSFESTRRIAMVVLGFSAIVFVHELGHFLVARACSVKCLAFSIGIGPRIIGWRKGGGLSFLKDPYDPDNKKDEADAKEPSAIEKIEAATVHSDMISSSKEPAHSPEIGDCDYRISLLPLGGYVRMLGQDDMDPSKVSTDPHAFNQRPIWQRMCIVSAGVIMNVICAAVIFSVVFYPSIGVMFPPAYIGNVMYGSPAYLKGMKVGDRIIAIDGLKPRGNFLEFSDVVISSALSSGEDEIKYEIERPGEPGTIILSIKPEKISASGFLAIGVDQTPSLNIYVDKSDPYVGKFSTDEVAQLKMLEKGDSITQVNDKPITTYAELSAKLQASHGEALTYTIHNPNAAIADRKITLRPQLDMRPAVRGYAEPPQPFGIRPRLTAGEPASGEPAAKAGIKKDDIILRVGDRTNPTLDEFIRIVSQSPGKEIPVVVQRGDAEITLTPTPKSVKGTGRLELAVYYNILEPAVTISDLNGAVGSNAELQKAKSLKLAAVDGVEVKDWSEFYGVLRAKKPDSKIAVTFSADGKPVTQEFTLAAADVTQLNDRTQYMLGLSLDNLMLRQNATSAWEGVLMGLEHTKKFIIQVYLTLGGMFRGTVSVSNLHGPLAIAKVGHDVQERGQVWLWYLMGMVSVNLAVANFLPLPIVDGGLFLLLILEKLRGRPLSIKTQTVIQTVGIVLLAGVFLYVTVFNDIPFLRGGH